MARLSVELDNELKDKFTVLCEVIGLNPSVVTRMFIQQALYYHQQWGVIVKELPTMNKIMDITNETLNPVFQGYKPYFLKDKPYWVKKISEN